MEIDDFEEEDIPSFADSDIGTLDDFNNDEIDFDNPNGTYESKEKKEKVQTKKTPGNKIEISIDSVEDLISNLTFVSKELESSVDKVEKIKNLSKILDLLSQIKLHDYSSLEEKIDIKKIESSIKKTIDNKINNSLSKVEFKKLEAASNKYEKYAEIFESVQVMNTFEQIDKLEIFMKNFKFKSIVASVIITSIISFIVAFMSIGAYYSYTNSNSNESLNQFLSNVKYKITEDENISRLILKTNNKTSYYDDKKKGLIIIDYNK